MDTYVNEVTAKIYISISSIWNIQYHNMYFQTAEQFWTLYPKGLTAELAKASAVPVCHVGLCGIPSHKVYVTFHLPVKIKS